MTYEYKCDECGAVETVTAPMTEGPPTEVLCSICKAKMHRVWSASIQIPDYMRASHGGDQHTAMVHRMKHAKRPSGRDKTLF